MSNILIDFYTLTLLNCCPKNGGNLSYAKKNNSYLIEINPNQTAISDIVDLNLRGTSGTILPKFVKDYQEMISTD